MTSFISKKKKDIDRFKNFLNTALNLNCDDFQKFETQFQKKNVLNKQTISEIIPV